MSTSSERQGALKLAVLDDQHNRWPVGRGLRSCELATHSQKFIAWADWTVAELAGTGTC
jgi:hypothetical protein